MTSNQDFTISTPVPFNQGWALEDTRATLDQPPFPKDGTPSEQEDWRREIGFPGDDKLAKAIGRHVAHLLQQGHGVIPPHSEGINIWFLHHLRELDGNPQNEELQIEVGRPFVRNMLVYSVLNRAKREASDARGVHDGLVKLIEEGDFDSVLSDDHVCHNTGLRINVQLNQWNGVAGTHKYIPVPDRYLGRFEFEPLEPDTVKAPQTHTQSIPVPSGTLWISDWFRIEAFNELTQTIDKAEPHDAMDSTEGRSLITRRYAEQFGVGHVFCKSPDIVSSMGAITAGKCHTDEESWESIRPAGHVGKIDADLRWTTIVDRQHLIDLIAQKLGREAAIQQVDDYESSHKDIIKIQVEPGQHHLYFSGDAQTFKQTIEKQFESEGLFLDEDYQRPGFALTQEPLTKRVAKLARKAAPGA